MRPRAHQSFFFWGTQVNPADQGTGLLEFTTIMSNAFLSPGPFETLAFLAVYASKGKFSFGSTFGTFGVLSSSSRKDQTLGRVEERDLLPSCTYCASESVGWRGSSLFSAVACRPLFPWNPFFLVCTHHRYTRLTLGRDQRQTVALPLWYFVVPLHTL